MTLRRTPIRRSAKTLCYNLPVKRSHRKDNSEALGLCFLPFDGRTVRAWKAGTKGFLLSKCCPQVDKAAHRVPVADKKRDAAKLTSPAAWRCTATTKTSRTTDDQRLARVTGAGQFECDRQASTEAGRLGVTGILAVRDSRACLMDEPKSRG
jgi:hypothetical protein